MEHFKDIYTSIPSGSENALCLRFNEIETKLSNPFLPLLQQFPILLLTSSPIGIK